MGFRFLEFRVYKDAKDFYLFCMPYIKKLKDENLKNQITRALNSILLNIAEGSADNSDTEFARFLGISIRSVYEVAAGFDIALLFSNIDVKDYSEIETKAEILVKQLSSFRNKLRK